MEEVEIPVYLTNIISMPIKFVSIIFAEFITIKWTGIEELIISILTHSWEYRSMQ